MRYRLYREHKYLVAFFSKTLQECGCLDFSSQKSIEALKESLAQLFALLNAHAEHEDTRIHTLLKVKGSTVVDKAESEHEQHHNIYDVLNEQLQAISTESSDEAKQALGYQLYLALRDFFAETLVHLNYEERVIMPELQRLFSDDELREIDFATYRQMQPEQMVHMIEALNPYLNRNDRAVFFDDINRVEPEKFSIAWEELKELVGSEEARALESKLIIAKPSRSLDPIKKLKYPWEDVEPENTSQIEHHNNKD